MPTADGWFRLPLRWSSGATQVTATHGALSGGATITVPDDLATTLTLTLTFAFAFALAFYKHDGRHLDFWIERKFTNALKPRVLLWTRERPFGALAFAAGRGGEGPGARGEPADLERAVRVGGGRAEMAGQRSFSAVGVRPPSSITLLDPSLPGKRGSRSVVPNSRSMPLNC